MGKRVLGVTELEAGLDGDLLRQRLVCCLDVSVQLLLDHGVDSHAAEQHDDDKEQIHAHQLDKERSMHERQHGQTPKITHTSTLTHYVTR